MTTLSAVTLLEAIKSNKLNSLEYVDISVSGMLDDVIARTGKLTTYVAPFF